MQVEKKTSKFKCKWRQAFINFAYVVFKRHYELPREKIENINKTDGFMYLRTFHIFNTNYKQTNAGN